MTGRTAYDLIGVGYAELRRPDPLIAALIMDAVADSRTILSVGAGAGSYEPRDRAVVAVEPSSVMIEQRPTAAAPVVRGFAEELPVRSASFDAALAVLTIHHWRDPWAGIAEMQRVSRRQVVLTFDPDEHSSHWLVEYVPELVPIFGSTPPIGAVARALGAAEVVRVPLRHDTPDGMTIAFWRRPEAYLDPKLRAGGSALHQVDRQALRRGLEALEADLATGEWRRRFGYLLEAETMDYGLRLVVA